MRDAAVEELLTITEIPKILKMNQQTVRNSIDHGKLPAVHNRREVASSAPTSTD
jgi:hypothetical protein